MAGQNIIILNTAQAAFELMDKRGSNYSDRPRMIMASEILCNDLAFSLIPYGPRWKLMRKATHAGMKPHGAETYKHIQEFEASFLIKDLLNDPVDWEKHLRRATASSILSIVYGKAPTMSAEDPDVLRIEDFMDSVVYAGQPGNFLVDSLPVLNLLPPWLAKFKRKGHAAHKRFCDLFMGQLQDSKSRKHYTDIVTFSETLLNEQEALGLSEDDVAWTAGIMFGAGSDTSVAALAVFVLAMVLHPAVAQKAQAEIDRVVGRDRLPRFADQEHLPYVGALIKETMRWRPIAPLGIARRAMQDDVYDGYDIPRGSMVIPNIWAICHDPVLYPNPAELNPERFLTEDGQHEINPSGVRADAHAFGFGRRICGGMAVANNTLFIDIACILWAFNFLPADDGPPSADAFLDHGIVMHPSPFHCKIVPRADNLATILGTVRE